MCRARSRFWLKVQGVQIHDVNNSRGCSTLVVAVVAVVVAVVAAEEVDILFLSTASQ